MIEYFDSAPIGKFIMLGSKMIYQSSTMVFLSMTSDYVFKMHFLEFQLSLLQAVHACLKLNMSLLMANDNAKVSALMKAFSG
jgi:hypothetical protein